MSKRTGTDGCVASVNVDGMSIVLLRKSPVILKQGEKEKDFTHSFLWFIMITWKLAGCSVNAPGGNGGSQQGFHYVLSKSQEDEIRESFLLEKIKNYTQVR